MTRTNTCLALFALLASGLTTGCRSDDARSLTIFHAGSLSMPMHEIAEAFEARNPEIQVYLEAAGSRTCARKIAELGQRCDLFASADYRVIENLLIPDHASWYLNFATNELVLAYRKSLDPAQIPTATSWPDLALDPTVRVGRADADADPCGYRTLQLFELAETHFARPGLAAELRAKDQRFIRPKSVDLIALLETGSLDFAFLYKSVALQHDVPHLLLPDALNLGNQTHSSTYHSAKAEVSGIVPGETIVLQGVPIRYALTIPTTAQAHNDAIAFAAFLLAPDGGLEVLERHHQQPLPPESTPFYDELPEALKPYALPGTP